MTLDQVHPELPLKGGRVVAATRGPWLERILVESGGMYTWIEVPLPDSPYAPAAVLARIREISRLLDRDAVPWLLLPDIDTLASRGVFAHAPVPSGKTIFEMMQSDGWERAIPFTDIGRRLAALHGTALNDAAVPSLPRGQPPLDILGSYWSKAPADGELALLQRCLEACEPFRRLVASTSEADGSSGVLLHGRWSSGALICSDAEPGDVVACGGIDMWIGPPELDLGYLFGELMEHAAEAWLAGERAGVVRAIEAMGAVVAGYQQRRNLDAGRVAGFTARRILSHLIANTRWRRQQGQPPPSAREIVGLFSAAERLFPELERCLALKEPCALHGREA